MEETYEKANEFGGVTIESTDDGFVISYHMYNEDDIADRKVLVPYGTWGFVAETDLDAAYDEKSSNGEILADLALDDSRLPPGERKVEVIEAKGEGAHLALQESASESLAETGPAPGRGDGTVWYFFSLKKSDEAHYGECVDLFTEMYLTHTSPQGMSLWTTSDYDTEGNLFFAQLPEGLDVTNDRFFSVFPLRECASPPKVGLSLLIGRSEQDPGKRRVATTTRHWWPHMTSSPSAAGRAASLRH